MHIAEDERLCAHSPPHTHTQYSFKRAFRTCFVVVLKDGSFTFSLKGI